MKQTEGTVQRSTPKARSGLTVSIMGPMLLAVCGALLLLLASITLPVAVSGQIALGDLSLFAGFVFVLASVVWLGVQTLRRRARAEDVTTGRTPSFLAPVTLVLVAVLFVLLPIPAPYTWLNVLAPLLFLLGAVLSALRVRALDNSSPVRQAQRAFERGDLEAALRASELWLQQRPDDEGVYHLQAMIYRRRSQYDAARQAATRLIALLPEAHLGYTDLGLSFLEEGAVAEALEPLHKADELAPRVAECALNWGIANAKAGDYGSAASALRRALRIGLYDEAAQMLAHYYLLVACRALGQEAQAQRELLWLQKRREVLKRWRQDLERSTLATADLAYERGLIVEIECELGAA